MTSLSDRLRSAQPNKANRNLCATCQWLENVTPQTRELINEWLFDNDHSVSQLHDILTAPSDDAEPLVISLTGFRFHLRHHQQRWPRGA